MDGVVSLLKKREYERLGIRPTAFLRGDSDRPGVFLEDDRPYKGQDEHELREMYGEYPFQHGDFPP